jgi:hypothetical protein
MAMGYPPHLLRDTTLSAKVGTNFTDKRRSFGRCSWLADSGHEVIFLVSYYVRALVTETSVFEKIIIRIIKQAPVVKLIIIETILSLLGSTALLLGLGLSFSLHRGSVRLKAATYAQDNTNKE